MHEFDAEKLQENALTSIRLGIEDFQRSQLAEAEDGDPARALSAIRNLFAGVLLLFKYKIAISVIDPADAPALIFNPPEVLPHADGDGGIEWKPVGKFRRTTIDVSTIKKRFEGFEIEVDWAVIDKLQECRNHLEHLHPANTLGEVADFVAELFPVLRDFIQTQLNQQPAELLGSAWPIMLNQHQFLVDTIASCSAKWASVGVPKLMAPWLEECKCENCGSSLLSPHPEEIEDGAIVENDSDDFRYVCTACGYSNLVFPLMLKELNEANYYNPRDGEEPLVEECGQCGKDVFLVEEQRCLWCGAELEYTECAVCGEALGQDDQWNGGLCGYHNYQREKMMSDD